MSFYDDASLIVYPSGYKEDKIYSLKPTDGSGDLDFTRASTATRVNADGLIETSPVNLMPFSETFNFATGGWILQAGATTIANSGTAPNGTNTATLLYPSVTNAIVAPNRRAEPVTAPDTAIYTQYVYAKASGKNWLALYQFNGFSGTAAWFNLSTGVVGTVASGCTAFIESVGNGWYKCGFSQSVGSGVSLYMHVYPTDTDNTVTITASGTNGILIWGAQLNLGSTAKTYFPTTDRLNVPRIDYSNGCGSLLLEPQSTNLNTYSESISSWLTERVSVTSNAIASPSGNIDADKIVSDTTASTTHQVYVGAFTNTAGNVVLSGYFKKGEYEWLHFGQGAAASKTWFNLNTGQVGVKSSLVVSASITDAGNGWFRCVSVLNITTTSNYIEFGLAVSDGNRVITGTPPSGGLYGWGIQLEDASTYATSYIISNSGTTTTRIADAASKTGLSSLIGQTEGTILVDVDFKTLSGTNMFVSIRPDASNKVEIYRDGSTIYGEFTSSSSFNFNKPSVTVGRYKIAVSYSSGSSAMYINGVLIGSNTTTFAFTSTLDDIYINSRGGSSFIEQSEYSQVLLFKTKLTDDELADLTGAVHQTFNSLATFYNYTIL